MKTLPLISLQLPCFVASALLACGAAVSAAVAEKDAPAANTAEGTVITATGKVFSVEPGLLSVVMKDNPTPVQFSYNKDTPILDEKGTPIPLDLVRVELPLTVHYIMDGDKMAAQRVVISRSMVAGDANEKPEKKRKELAEETTREESRTAASADRGPVEMSGSLSSVDQTISIVARGETMPTMCVVNNSTRFVNIAGQPVGTHLLTAGMAVTVKSVRDGKRLIAQEVIIHGNPSTMAGNGGTQGSSQGGPGNPNTGGGANSNNTSGNSGGLSDLPVQGFILPGQLPGQIGARPTPVSGGTNPNQTTIPNQGTNQNQGTNPNQGTNSGQNTPAQPNTQQPGTTQPNTSPAGATPKPAPNPGSNSGTGGTSSGTGSGGSAGGSGNAAPAPGK